MAAEIAIHGLGYVGLTAAVHFARAGWRVLGYDPDQVVVDALNAGTPRAGEFLSYINADARRLVQHRFLRATTDFDEAAPALFHVLCVPTENNGHPFDGIVQGVLTRLVEQAPPRATIMIESTLTPGFIDRMLGEVSRFKERVGGDLFVAVCPRRDWFADPEKNLETLPRIVGGVTSTCTRRATYVLKTVSREILETTYRTAELTKALENALLHVPVMFAYQLAYALPEHDVAEALRLAGTHWRLTPLYLGFGTGGRCVPLGTEYLVAASGDRLDLGQRALEWDTRFRLLIADITEKLAPRTALVLGMAYRPGFRDMGLSPGVAVARALKSRGIHAYVHDPLWTPEETHRLVGVPPASPHRDFDVVLLATGHQQYDDLPTTPRYWREGQYVIDGPGAWAPHARRFEQMGVRYRRVGQPGWMNP